MFNCGFTLYCRINEFSFRGILYHGMRNIPLRFCCPHLLKNKYTTFFPLIFHFLEKSHMTCCHFTAIFSTLILVTKIYMCRLIINPFSANPTKWSNTLKQFVGDSGQIVSVCLTILWGWCSKG